MNALETPGVLETLFNELAVVLLAAAVVGAIAVRLRQPLIIAFIAVGLLVGPAALGWIEASEELELLAEFGIAILLFVVGLKLDLHLIRTMGPVALITGLGQVIFTSVAGYFICLALGLSQMAAIYVAVALTFSSTIIIVKLLSDKKEIDSLHGRVALGFLIVQDIVVVLAMIVLTALGTGERDGAGFGVEMLGVLVNGIGLLVAIGLLMRYVLPRVLEWMARSYELLVLFGIAWAVGLAMAGDLLGFSKEVGAFLAGISLASTPYREAIGSRLTSVRDFLLFFFFIHLGTQLDLGLLGAQVAPALVLSAFVLVGNPLVVMILMGLLGYRKRTGFLAGLTVAQISEFSLILGALGMNLGYIDAETMGLITLVGLITIGASTYMILYSHPLYERLAPLLSPFERKVAYREQAGAAPPAAQTDVILFGLGRFGSRLEQTLKAKGLTVLGVDFDPDVVHARRKRGLQAVYGDAEDPEFGYNLPLSSANFVVSTLIGEQINKALVEGLRSQGYTGPVAVTIHNKDDEQRYERLQPDLVLNPFETAADMAATEVTRRMTRQD